MFGTAADQRGRRQRFLMARADPHGIGFRGVYRGPSSAKLKTKTYKSRKQALQAAQDEEARLRSRTWFDPAAGRVTFADYFGQVPGSGVTADTSVSG